MPRPKSPGVRKYLQRFLWRSPYCYWLFGLIRQRKNILSSHFDILIDGYPRSANTFAVYAFKEAQTRPVRVSSHHHNPAAVLAAISMRKPVLVLVRNPLDAVASWTIFSGYPVRYNLETYINYYSLISARTEGIEVGEFQDITSRFSSIIGRINRRFAVGFDEGKGRALDIGGIFQAIERDYTAENGFVDENRVSRPSASRELAKRAVIEQMQRQEIMPRLEIAMSLYAKLCGRG